MVYGNHRSFHEQFLNDHCRLHFHLFSQLADGHFLRKCDLFDYFFLFFLRLRTGRFLQCLRQSALLETTLVRTVSSLSVSSVLRLFLFSLALFFFIFFFVLYVSDRFSCQSQIHAVHSRSGISAVISASVIFSSVAVSVATVHTVSVVVKPTSALVISVLSISVAIETAVSVSTVLTVILSLITVIILTVSVVEAASALIVSVLTIADLSDSNFSLSANESDLTATKDSLTAKECELTTTKDTLTAKEAELTATKDSLTTAETELAATKDSLTTATTELEATKATLAATEAELTTTQETLADAQAILAASNESLSFAKLNPATRGTDPGIAPSPMASAVRDPSEAVAFLLVTVGTKTYEPIPLLEDGYYRLIHGVCVNIIHVTETSIEMTDASCADHDCIAQGIVTLENKDTREGGSYIICQQNFVTLRLCTRAELEAEGIVLQ